MFQETYHRMNDGTVPSPALVERTLAAAHPVRHPRRPAMLAAVLCLCLATPALAAQTEPGYALLYAAAPAVAQFFQPVRQSCLAAGVTMEVVSVSVAGDTAQAVITLCGAAIDGDTDLFDSYSFHAPFDQISHCAQTDYDSASGTATFLVTTQTMDGSAIPGGKMTFSLGEILTGKTAAMDVAVGLSLADCTRDAPTAPAGGYSPSGSDGPMLAPGETLTEPVPGITVTAAGYADGQFHVQTRLGETLRTDNHCRLWILLADGSRVSPVENAWFRPDGAITYVDSVFDLAPEEVAGGTLHGDFYTADTLIQGPWQVTFSLKNT